MLRKIAVAHDPIIVQPYLGYGTPERLTLRGRVLQDEGIDAARADHSRLRNVTSFLKLMESDEIPGARVRATFRGVSAEAVSDSEGYFRLELQTRAVEPGWHDVDIELEGGGSRTTAAVLVPHPDAEFAVISDIDDTIIQSNVMRKLRMLATLASSNAHTRKPFAGVAAFYRALHRDRNPFFYVSKSPWNLYLPLLEFLRRQKLLQGPLMLRDFGLRMAKDHKTRVIDEILSTYRDLKFILIGDSGEEDPEVYSRIVARFPDRIRVIYIRSIDPSTTRQRAIARLAESVAATGCQLVLAADSAFAAAHATAERLIAAAELRKIQTNTKTDRE